MFHKISMILLFYILLKHFIYENNWLIRKGKDTWID